MQIVRSVSDMKQLRSSWHASRGAIGFVPTMGALHAGHLALIRRSLQENERTVVSIFVNPAQFNNPDDFRQYPVTESEDVNQLESVGVTAVFIPEVDAIYPQPAFTSLRFGRLENFMEGAYRPGHFQGVALILAKLLHMVQPDRLYLGRKDLQQAVIVQQMVSDLNFSCEVVVHPVVRDDRGLALSSRNKRLSKNGLEQASLINRLLKGCCRSLQQKQGPAQVRDEALKKIAGQPGVQLEYLEIVDRRNLEPLKSVNKLEHVAICIAAYVEGVRLIDNMDVMSYDD